MSVSGVGGPLPFPQPVPDQAVIAAVQSARPAVEQLQQTAAAVVAPVAPEGQLDIYM